MSGRTRKVESQLKEITGEEVASLSDPRIQGLVTITGVRVSPDLAHATVFYSETAAHDGLQSAAGRIQAAVGAQTRLKRTPRLHFEPDPVVERATKIEAVLREVRTDDDAHEE